MKAKSSEATISLSDLKSAPEKVVSLARDTHSPILLTNHGHAVAVIQSLEDHERATEELRLVKAVAKGLMDFHEDNTVSLEGARKALGIK